MKKEMSFFIFTKTIQNKHDWIKLVFSIWWKLNSLHTEIMGSGDYHKNATCLVLCSVNKTTIIETKLKYKYL